MNIELIVIAAVVLLFLAFGIRVVRPTHRALIERMGKYRSFGRKGFNWIIPFVDRLVKVDVTENMIDAEAGKKEGQRLELERIKPLLCYKEQKEKHLRNKISRCKYNIRKWHDGEEEREKQARHEAQVELLDKIEKKSQHFRVDVDDRIKKGDMFLKNDDWQRLKRSVKHA